ncbi:MAG: Na+/H+ antiporter NhaA, partial [Bacteroidales bacterium]|nr:Na+/H+ antiporter NhaA [Bacteroidales bacterium]
MLTRLYNEFFKSEKTGGLILLFVTLLSIGLANSSLQTTYISFWQLDVGGHSILHWINDGFMTIFFLLIGLELERVIFKGELSDIKNASLP